VRKIQYRLKEYAPQDADAAARPAPTN
jgi:hypothetical protein